MVNWLDPAEQARDNRIMGALLLVLVGVSTWEVLITSAFDWSIITRRRKWKWPMALYFICRICLVLHIWAVAIDVNVISELNCGALTYITKFPEAVGTCIASLILALRTYAVWGADRMIGGMLLLLWMGQVALWSYLTSFWRAAWDPKLMLCYPVSFPAKPPIYLAAYSYTMTLDFINLLLLVWRLHRHRKSTGIIALLLNDGISYFIFSVMANGSETVFSALRLNPVMDLMTVSFASVVSMIAATRLFRHAFEEFDLLAPRNTPETSSVLSPIGFRNGRLTEGSVLQIFALADTRGMCTVGPESVGVHVFTETDVERDAPSVYDIKDPSFDT